MRSEFIIWYEDGKYDRRENTTIEEVISEYKDCWKKVTTITEEFYVDGQYVGEVDYNFEDFCKNNS